MDATERFAARICGSEADVRLDEVALLIAAHAHPGLDVSAQQIRLDDLAAAVPSATLNALCTYLFDECRFTGNVADYYDPENSYLDRVLDRRLGIPITLSLVLIEVGRRIGLDLAGVPVPGHFLVADRADPGLFVDAFAGGSPVDRPTAERQFRRPSGAARSSPSLDLRPAGPRVIVARMLANLDVIATARADRTMLCWVTRLQVAMPQADPSLHRRLAAVLAASGRFDEAADVLSRLADSPQGSGSEDRAAALRFRARLS